MAAQARKLRAVGKPKPTGRRVGRPKTRLTSAVAPNATEREMLVILRNKIAAKLDGDVPMTSFTQLIRQFERIDHKIRAIDARAAEAADGDNDDDLDDDDGDAGWDPSAV